LSRQLREAGADFQFGTDVSGFRASGGRIDAVETTRGTFSGDEYVLAGGAWSPSIVRGLGIKLPMQAGKGYSLTLPTPPRLPQICSILIEARVAVTPMGSALRFAGTMEIAGNDTSVNAARVRGIVNSIPSYFPQFSALDFADIKPWAGLRPCSPDGLPYVGRFAHFRNLSAATGHSMMGLSLGPITGRLMAEVLSGEKPSIDLTLMSPDRYG
jgi:D-amino-acid dehydrogenase